MFFYRTGLPMRKRLHVEKKHVVKAACHIWGILLCMDLCPFLPCVSCKFLPVKICYDRLSGIILFTVCCLCIYNMRYYVVFSRVLGGFWGRQKIRPWEKKNCMHGIFLL